MSFSTRLASGGNSLDEIFIVELLFWQDPIRNQGGFRRRRYGHEPLPVVVGEMDLEASLDASRSLIRKDIKNPEGRMERLDGKR